MKSCIGCKHADWKQTAKGNLCSSGDGQCRYPYEVPPLPAALYWHGLRPETPSGGYINRHQEFTSWAIDKVCPTREVQP